MASLVYRLLALAAVATAHLEPRPRRPTLRARPCACASSPNTSSCARRRAARLAVPSSVLGSGGDDDDDWLDDYTYEEQELPVVFEPKPPCDDSGVVVDPPPGQVVNFPDTPPTDDGTTVPDIVATPQTLVCMVDPSNSEHAFNLVATKNGRFGRLTDDDFAGYTEEMIEAYKFPTFIFSAPSNGPAGFYDLVSTSGTEDLGRSSNGDVVVVSASSNGQTPVTIGGVEVVTTLFTVSCQSYISTGLSDGTSYVWTTDTLYATLAVGDANKDNSIFTLPSRQPPPETVEQRKRAESAGISRRRPLGSYSDGAAPRCPNWPRSLWANDRPGARGYNPNGCGSGAMSSFIPQFNFGECCNRHDDCFDNCYWKSFEQCNDEFTKCMVNDVCGRISWWHFIDKLNCKAAGYFYGWVVSSWPGRIAFYSANSDRCQCNCPVGLVQRQQQLRRLQPQLPEQLPEHALQRRRVPVQRDARLLRRERLHPAHRRTRIAAGAGASAPRTCTATAAGRVFAARTSGGTTATIAGRAAGGGCGNVCPRGTRCGGGQCVCAKDQCGNLCLDFQTYPRNCGSCGNVCPSGICHLGQCYTPTESDDSTVCRPRDGVVNGGFDNATMGYGWDVVTQTGQSNAGYGFDGGASSSPNSAAVSILNRYLEIHQKVQLCPNTEYALTYNIRKVGGTRGAYCVSAAIAAGQNTGAQVLPVDGGWESMGPIFIQVGQKTPWSRPWDPITFSDDGVFAYANLGIGMSCSAASAWSTFRIDDVSIYPV
ncbi:hypothetical protein AURDEDRAFT_188920 [Auricularia subglabra TFB-10046 SS5]|uniref:Uncharacterized protein n=1 Tax=Auricularia subglabra (strain TFB-10046 / SS5) TaxID=717982 RepID=J0WS23_AURST|nr:hypothetical protein AURDEDRAFT_188920 [Auricularia subglabra TFB-10046 SS5]